jgi:hypothetical protein
MSEVLEGGKGKGKGARSCHMVVSFDPGTTHLAYVVALAYVEPEGVELYPLKQEVLDVTSESRAPDPFLLDLMWASVMETVRVNYIHPVENCYIFIEYQPPLNTLSNPGLVRKNTWVEAYLETRARHCGIEYSIVASSAVKKWFRFPHVDKARQYVSNKKVSVEMAKMFLTGPLSMRMNDHIADCILNAVYGITKELSL